MSAKHPIISVTGSSGAGTSSVKETFEQIFRREKVKATYIEGDAYHRYDRAGMAQAMANAADQGNPHFSHFGPEANLLEELEGVLRQYAEMGTGKTRYYIRNLEEAERYGGRPALLRRGRRCRRTQISCSMRACTAPSSPTASISPSSPI